MRLSKIPEEVYCKLEVLEVFSNKLYAHSFGEISDIVGNCKFAWQSTIVEPQIIELSEFTYAIGIDQNFAIVNLSNKYINVNVYTDSCIVSIIKVKGCILVCTQLEVFKYNNGGSYELLSSTDLPEFFEDAIITDDKIAIKTYGGSLIDLQ